MRRLLSSTRRLLRVCAIVLGLVGLLALAAWLFFPQIGAWAVKSRGLPRLEAALGRELAVAEVEVTRSRVVLRGITVRGPADAEDRPLAQIARVAVDFDLWQAARGRPRLGAALIDGLGAHVVRHADGSDNVRDLLRRLREQGAAPQAGEGGVDTGAGVSLRPSSVTLTRGTLTVEDRGHGVELTVGGVSAELDAAGALSAELDDIAIDSGAAAGVGDGPRLSAQVAHAVLTTTLDRPVENALVRIEDATATATARHSVTLSAVSGTLSPEGGSALALDLAGSYGGSSEPLWQARGSIDLATRQASIDVVAEEFSFDRVDEILRDTVVVDYEETTTSADLHIEIDDQRVALAGQFQLRGLNVFHPMVAKNPLRDIEVAGELVAEIDRSARRIALERAELRSRGVVFSMNGALALAGGADADTGTVREQPRLSVRFQIPEVPCQQVLDAIPDAMVPYLEDFTLRGDFDADVLLEVDWADLDALTLDGHVGLLQCRARETGRDTIAERLAATFTHYVEVERDEWLAFDIGPENPDFVPLLEVSPHILNAFMTTEDSRFYDHKGFISREFRSALVKNLEAGYFRFGASSITMQTVKNVLLYREKTLARKLQELVLTWYIETQLEKDRILEIYVNAIEYGPGLYGIGPAVRHYFGKEPIDVNPVEAVFLASLLPSPKRRYQQYCEGRLWRATSAKIERVLGTMHDRERLSVEEYEDALLTPLAFDLIPQDEVRDCRRMVKRAIENARPTNPMLQ
ncbi:biosynthetic peptidoglycan transglycosylase [Haliangium ochraceum]|uniref:Glycosyl transferase family 51 n=1 Tax=Haliangium ochraceum (strain DSM 14365 / JCM 11303 / SMP-2) TaxID=502025 RepID=D0LR82_HALO1|nr:biosynthetic peptidoglycan transglycosylase [Haliangium ochraceum]ACY17110.1 glycosyl transferase family 51 [Haliangium ochraceum DSM 14365]